MTLKNRSYTWGESFDHFSASLVGGRFSSAYDTADTHGSGSWQQRLAL